MRSIIREILIRPQDHSTYLSDTMLRDLLDQTISKHYLDDRSSSSGLQPSDRTASASYIDHLLMPAPLDLANADDDVADELQQRMVALLARQRFGASASATGRRVAGDVGIDSNSLHAEQQADYDSLLGDEQQQQQQQSNGHHRPALRDQEYAHQSTLWGHHFVTGGHGEAEQFGGGAGNDDLADLVEDMPTGGNSANRNLQQQIYMLQQQQRQEENAAADADSIASASAMRLAAAAAAAGFRSSSHLPQIKSDATLPAYCNPPNPCPVGYAPANGCQTDFENTAAFSRDYQAAQECMCDSEHMFMCQQESKRNVGGGVEFGREWKRGGPEFERKNLVAKKFHPSGNSMQLSVSAVPSDAVNPYLAGEKLPVAAKKGVRMF